MDMLCMEGFQLVVCHVQAAIDGDAQPYLAICAQAVDAFLSSSMEPVL